MSVALASALPIVPTVAGLIGLWLSSRRVAAVLAIAGAAAALAVAVALAFVRMPVRGHLSVVQLGGLEITAGVRVDSAAAWVAIAVAAVALAVQVYSLGYLADDDRYAVYAAQISLFTAAMLNVVVASDLVQLLVGWEVMGACSYLLIAHDRRLPEAPGAAVKAFLVTRVGDVGFWLGIVLLGRAAGSFRIDRVLAAVPDISHGTLTAAALLLLCGVAGKSAQFPLHTWLPDAMAGPTPISALIHAATMVAAGVYFVTRLYPVFTTEARNVLGISAAITMLLGGLVACAQLDIKRVLAWSTVSQLGYMTGALAVGAPGAALFHLLTHAAFKALLFLAAGALIHAVHSNLMTDMGARLRGTVGYWAAVIGVFALVGVPPLAGFWSKESILGAAWEHRSHGVGWVVFAAAAITVALTGWYGMRLLRLTFGQTATPTQVDVELLARHADETRRQPLHQLPDTPGTMRWPLIALMVPAAGLGLLGLWPAFAHRLGAETLRPEWVTLVFALVAVVLGAGAAFAAPRAWLLRSPALLARAFYLDEVQNFLVVRPVRALARAVRAVDERVVDGAVEATGVVTPWWGGVLARAHAAGVPLYAGLAVVGGLVVGVTAAVIR